MTNKLVNFAGATIIVAAAVMLLNGQLLPGREVKAADENPASEFNDAVLDRIERIERKVASGVDTVSDQSTEQDSDQEDNQFPQIPDYTEQLTSMAESLNVIAEKAAVIDQIADSLANVVERLQAIEEELAWARLDREEEGTEEEPQENEQ